MNKGIILAEFGNRERQIRELLRNIREEARVDLPITILSDRYYEDLGSDVMQRVLTKDEVKWKGHKRYFNRNNDYWKVKGFLESHFEFSFHVRTLEPLS